MKVRSTELALAAAGALIAHELGYGAADALRLGGSDPGHGYLPILIGLLVPLSAFVAGLGILRLARTQVGKVRVGHLVVLQLVLFLALELSEHAAAGSAFAALSNPAVIIGLLAQPLVAWAIDRVLQRAASALASHRGDPLIPLVFPGQAVVAVADSGLGSFDWHLLPRRRGPPS